MQQKVDWDIKNRWKCYFNKIRDTFCNYTRNKQIYN